MPSERNKMTEADDGETNEVKVFFRPEVEPWPHSSSEGYVQDEEANRWRAVRKKSGAASQPCTLMQDRAALKLRPDPFLYRQGSRPQDLQTARLQM